MKAMFAFVLAAGLMLNPGASSAEDKTAHKSKRVVTKAQDGTSRKLRCYYAGNSTGDTRSGESSRHYTCD
jgi:hypothetical protein